MSPKDEAQALLARLRRGDFRPEWYRLAGIIEDELVERPLSTTPKFICFGDPTTIIRCNGVTLSLPDPYHTPEHWKDRRAL